MENAPVAFTQKESIALLTIDNPPVNALSQAVRAGIKDGIAAAIAADCKAIVLLCAGRTFIAGADITEFGKPPQAPSLPEVIEVIERCPVPVIAAIHGTALGGGLEVAMAAHYRCALPGARLGLPEVKLGLLPGAGGTQRLPRLVGVERALDMMLSGAPITGTEGLDLGLIDRCVDGDLAQTAMAYADELLAGGAGPRPTGERRCDAPADDDFFPAVRARTEKRMRGQLAPGLIIELVEIACSVPIDKGQAAERERFKQCLVSPQSAALRHVFFAERAAGKLKDIAPDTPSRVVERVAVIGAGTMGGGIAMCFANAGIPVTLVETAAENLERGMDIIRRNYAGSVKRGRFTQAQMDDYLGCISGTTDYADIATVDVVIEAVFENMEIKQQVFRTLDQHCKPGCILATNTSYLDVDAIAAVTGRPADVIGAHFFSPANVMKLLEVVRAAQTAPDVLQTFMAVAKRIGKTAVAVGVCHGFVGNRMLKGYARQSQLLLLEGATPRQLDRAMETWGMAMGPAAVGDLAGLDIGYRSRRDQGIESRSVREFILADTLVEMDRLGQKTGAGYYSYDPDTRQRLPDPTVEALIREIALAEGITQREIDDGEIVDRLLCALVNEGAAILSEGIAARASDIDIVWLNGYGFPAWRGGPMFWANQLGLAAVVEKMASLRELTEDSCWTPHALLAELAAGGGTFS